MKRLVITAIAAAVLSLAGANAGASTASVALANLHVELVDLDPSDGTTPSVSFQSLLGGTFVIAETGAVDASGHLVRSTDIRYGMQPFGSATASQMDGASTAFAGLVGNATDGGATVSSIASSSQAGKYSGGTVLLGDGAEYAPFTLSAHTRIVISADASASVNSTFTDGFGDVSASAFLSLTGADGHGSLSSGGVDVEQAGAHGSLPFTSSDDRRIEISFDNLGNDSLDGIFFGSLDTFAGDIAPIPEPRSAALFVAALGLIAWRRSARRAA